MTKLDRRTFVTVIALAPLVGADLSVLAQVGEDYAPREEFSGAPDWPQPKFSYSDYEVCWTGWKCAWNSRDICGQWVAYPLRRDEQCPLLVVNLPGLHGGVFEPGQLFDVSVLPDEHEQIYTMEGRRHLLELGRRAIIYMIDHKSVVKPVGSGVRPWLEIA